MFWITLLVWAVTTVAFELIRPKPKFEDARPSGLGDFQFPTATEGRAVPLVWGQVRINGPNVVWYGDFRKVAVREEVSTGMFSSEEYIKYYRYFIGMQFALCHGPVDSIDSIHINDKPVSVGTVTTDGGGMTVDAPLLYGGTEHGSGGIVGSCSGYLGTKTQPVNAYLTPFQLGAQPAYRGICYLVFEGGYVGTANSIAPWSFTVTRIPDGLNLAVEDPGAQTPHAGGANPMNVLYEILTNTDWGLGISSSLIDVSNFRDAASTLYGEGNGFAMFVDQATEIATLIDEIQRQIDGSLYFDRGQGQWKVRLARDDYTVGTLTSLDESSILSLKEYTRQTWEETSNQMRIQYTDRQDEFKTTYAVAQDPANANIQGQSVQSDQNYPGVKDRALANSIAWRDLKAASFPLAKVKFTMKRGAWALAPGSVFKLSWSSLGIVDLVMRVGKINYGKPGESAIEVFAIQDIFASSSGVYADPGSTNWDDPVVPPDYAAAGDTIIFEAPRQIVRQDPFAEYRHPRLWMSCRAPGGGTVNMKAYIDANATGFGDGTYTEDTSVYGFILAGSLASDLDAYPNSTEQRPATSYSIAIDDVDDLSGLEIDGDDDLIDELGTIIYLNGEFIGYEKATYSGGTLTLERIHRGLFNSAPDYHSEDDRVWFISQGGNLSRNYINQANIYTRTQLRGANAIGTETTEIETPEIDVLLGDAYLDPLPPRDPYLNDVYADAVDVSVDVDYATELSQTGKDGLGIKIAFTPRDWREDVPTLDENLGPLWAGEDPEFDVDVSLDWAGTPAAISTQTIDDQSTTPEIIIPRNEFIKALGPGRVWDPAEARLLATPSHFVAANPETGNPMEFRFTTDSVLEGYDIAVGPFYTSSDPFVVGETGAYDFDLETGIPGGAIQANVNGGGFVDVISSGNASGAIVLSSGDSVVLRATAAPAYDQFLDIAGPTSETAYGVVLA